MAPASVAATDRARTITVARSAQRGFAGSRTRPVEGQREPGHPKARARQVDEDAGELGLRIAQQVLGPLHGVPIALNIRGVCCLVPGVEGLSDNITVTSVVGRFLEHSRIFEFRRGSEEHVYIGSADLMPRNLDTRVELVAPVEDPALRAVLADSLDRAFADTVNAWDLGPDGDWVRRNGDPADPAARSLHRELMELHRPREGVPE